MPPELPKGKPLPELWLAAQMLYVNSIVPALDFRDPRKLYN